MGITENIDEFKNLSIYFGRISSGYADVFLDSEGACEKYLLYFGKHGITLRYTTLGGAKKSQKDYTDRVVYRKNEKFYWKDDEKNDKKERTLFDKLSDLLQVYVANKTPCKKPVWLFTNAKFEVSNAILGGGNYSYVKVGKLNGFDAAAKVLKAQNETVTEDLLKEVAIGFQMSLCPYIISIYGVCVENLPLSCLMEFMKCPLLMILKEEKIQEVEMFLFVVQLLKAMKYLEDAKIVHRDLAARNCLINKYGILKLTDFGLAGNADEFWTSDSKVPIKWRAPETISIGYSKYDIKADVWSFGVVVVEIYTRGKSPLEKIESDIYREQLKKYPAIKLYTAPEGTGAFSETLEKCWDSNPEERPTFKKLLECASTILADMVLPELTDLMTAKINEVRQLTMAEHEILHEIELAERGLTAEDFVYPKKPNATRADQLEETTINPKA